MPPPRKISQRLCKLCVTLPNVKGVQCNIWYEGGVTEDRNLYHCDPCMKIKIFNLRFHFQFLSTVMAKQDYT